ncbi:glycogen synthase GlgA [Anaeromyxobacter paludicola]|uniref:Glycogen synthase n=1 Tax=Anaeromyxobacter paludicola TaxID=2918171 RepID=A0ABM7XBQ3_9BACT|nr:glycogen synthase GlgA [Anaeromyxobacter paludicola]BDG09296.1 glycogen synthase [Anaeromyxobacter paludicola]
MDLLFLASEVAPWSKTGGLGDVAGALPRALAARGHRVVVATPRYGSIDPAGRGLRRVDLTLHARGERAGAYVADGPAPVYFIEHERLFGHRRGLYGEHGRDYPDNAARFAFFTRAALDLPAALGFSPRVVHLNDWQTALGAWLVRHEKQELAWARGARTVLTIHNLAYQGVFGKHEVPAVGLPWEVFRYEAMEFYDQLNFMKAGLVFADALTTVSPTYAREILTPESGNGLDPQLRHRARDLHGILNGIDVREWDPAADPHLPARFSRDDLSGKAACKEALQRELRLPVRPGVPLVGMVGRLAEQKGLDLVAAALPDLLRQDVQVAVLGSGRHDYEELFRRVAREQPDRLAAHVGFDEGLAHRIEAGADVFLMPSRFEPCGLNQMYSLRYGTVPVVRAVGGLEDTVEDYDGFRSGTGFKFREYQPRALLTAVRRALDLYRDRRAWAGLQARGMAQDFSWDRSAQTYERLFESLAAR